MPRFTAKSRGIGARGGVGKRGRTAGYKFFEDRSANPADPAMIEKAKALFGDPLPNLLETRRKGHLPAGCRHVKEDE